MKKLIAMLLVVVLIVAMVPVFACADNSKLYIYELRSLMPNEVYVCYNDATTEEGFKFHVNASYALCYDVFMDGEKIAWDTYESYPDDGGITYKLYQDYLNTLPAGKHVLSVWYTDGNRAKAEITVCSVKDYPLTGDSSNLILWSSLMAISAVVCAGAWVSLRKKETF